MSYIIYMPEGKGKQYEQFSYPAGELQVRFTEEQLKLIHGAGNSLKVVARIKSSDDVLALALLSSALDGCLTDNLEGIDLVLPYLPYSRADRRFGAGDCFGLQVFSVVISDCYYNRVLTLDVHSQVANEHVWAFKNVSPTPLILEAVAQIGNSWDLAIILPDKGADRYELSTLTQNIYHCEKDRDEVTGKLLGFKVPQEIKRHKKALIVDDICDGGGTFVGIAKELSGVELYLYVTHSIFSKGTDELLKYFTKIFSTDSFSTAEVPGVHKFPCMSLFS